MNLDAVLQQKHVISVESSTTVLAAAQRMCDRKVGALLVRSSTGEAEGIMTERDILRFCAVRACELDKTPVSEVMTRNLIVAPLDTTLDEAETIMTSKKIRHLLIVDGREEGAKIIGMLSMGDLVDAKLRETTSEAKYLRDYVNLSWDSPRAS